MQKAKKQETFCAFVDFHKAFDFVKHELLLHKLTEIGIEGNVYQVIKYIYANSVSCVAVNDWLMDLFPVKSGVRQEDSLSLILFAIYINDLATEMFESGLTVPIGEEKLPLLMYAEDMVVFGQTVSETQLLDIFSNWCLKWSMKAIIKKSQIVHCTAQSESKNDSVTEAPAASTTTA